MEAIPLNTRAVSCLDDLERLAREALPREAYDYIAGGAGDEWTLRENQAAFERLQLLPRVLRDVTQPKLEVTVLGRPLSMPVLIAPTAFHGLVNDDAELGTMKAAVDAGVIMCASTASNCTLESIASAGGTPPHWFQLYIYRDRELTRSLVERAEAAGYGALCVTVDVPRLGRRRRDVLNSFCLPGHLKLGNFVNREASDVTKIEGKSGLESYVSSQMDAAVTWKDIDWLRSICSLPVVLKGIMTPEDARLAVEHEVRGIVVSNHGGRQLDGVPATIEVLARVADAVRGECEVLLDGGIRRGTDVLKALALGARAILVGRPILWGLAVDGAAGARIALELLREELAAAMALVGCDSVDGLSRSLIWDSRRKGVLE